VPTRHDLKIHGGWALLLILSCTVISAVDPLLQATIRARSVLNALSECSYPLTVPNLVNLPAPNGLAAVYYPSSSTIQTDKPTDEILLHETFHHLTARMSQKCRDELMVKALTILATRD
jgi:hypothetical protein